MTAGPDNRKGNIIMSNRILTERVRATALNMGMDLVGFAPVEEAAS